ncbi:MAG TPA: secretin N-terminal domain-containing protein, partial [bacterium]|nr:secretin N-terminal domain-containing protein [bacterium]
ADDLGNTPITLHATGTPLMDILSVLSEKSGLNIVASTDVETREISIHLTNTPIEEALNLIVRAAGLGYERIGDSVLVAPQEQLTQDTGFASYVLEIEYADAFELVPLVEKIAERVAADPGGNRLVVVATPGMIDQIRGVVKQLDVPPMQIMLETEVIEVSTDRMAEYGIDWDNILHQSVIFAEPNGATPPPDSDYGDIPESMPFIGRGMETHDIYRQAMALEIALDLLEQEGGAKILSNSKLATLNNRTASIHIGDVIPYAVSNLTSGGVLQQQVQKERVGVKVEVTPRAAGDGHITVMVEPSVSNIIAFRGPNEEYPWTKERTATTQVRVMDGQTFMIAGLLSEDETETITKVPLLGDIPGLGYLFRHSNTTVKKSDLLIKITPRIIP